MYTVTRDLRGTMEQ